MNAFVRARDAVVNQVRGRLFGLVGIKGPSKTVSEPIGQKGSGSQSVVLWPKVRASGHVLCTMYVVCERVQRGHLFPANPKEQKNQLKRTKRTKNKAKPSRKHPSVLYRLG